VELQVVFLLPPPY